MLKIKYICILVLILQNTLNILLMKYSQLSSISKRNGEDYLQHPSAPPYISSTVVIMVELVKLFICYMMIYWKEFVFYNGCLLKDSKNYDPQAGPRSRSSEKISTRSYQLLFSFSSYHRPLIYIWNELILDYKYTLKMILPACLYAIQNNLLFVALNHLDTIVFQLTYQLKILTTALFSVILLRKHISWLKWFSLIFLMFGVFLVQWQSEDSSSSSSSGSTPISSTQTYLAASSHMNPSEPILNPSHQNIPSNGFPMISLPSNISTHPYLLPLSLSLPFLSNDGKELNSSNSKTTFSSSKSPISSKTSSSNSWIGFIAVILACLSSGLSGIYFEMLLKFSMSKINNDKNNNNIKTQINNANGHYPAKPSKSIWFRNIQLGIFGLFFSIMTCIWKDSADLCHYGFFHGYDYLIIIIIFVQAVGGLVVALVVKYADNILKSFATSFSIILSSIISFYFGTSHLTPGLILGSCSIILSSSIYSIPEEKFKSIGHLILRLFKKNLSQSYIV